MYVFYDTEYGPEKRSVKTIIVWFLPNLKLMMDIKANEICCTPNFKEDIYIYLRNTKQAEIMFEIQYKYY
jgi:hypothetical protein